MTRPVPPLLEVPPFLQDAVALKEFARASKANRKQLGEFRDWIQAVRDRTSENVAAADQVLANLRIALGEFNA